MYQNRVTRRLHLTKPQRHAAVRIADFVHRGGEHDPPLVDDGDPIGDPLHFVEQMG